MDPQQNPVRGSSSNESRTKRAEKSCQTEWIESHSHHQMERPRGGDAKSGAIAITGNGCSNDDDDDLSIYMDGYLRSHVMIT
jgi:hypothetical protein